MSDDTWKVTLDTSLCSGFGDCAAHAPGIFELGDDGIARLRTGTTSDEAVIDAVESCPMAALAAWRIDTGEQVA